jgi:hypothetical protein
MHLVCSENQFSSLNLAECIVLAKLQCDNNNLSSLNLANCIALSELNCSDNSLDSLDISNNTALTYIRLNGMPTLFKVCVWTTPFPPDSISFSSNRSPNVYFTTKCSDYISPDITAVDSLLPDYIEATSSKDGMIYLVDEETDKDIVAIQEACIDSVEALANTPVIISLSGMNNGVYWLYASDTAGNISEPEAFTIIVGIDQTRDNSYRIYPNPTKNYVTIETEQPDYRSIDITSLNGQLIYNISMEGTSQQIDLSTFNKGVYIITIRSKNNVTTEKIIIL